MKIPECYLEKIYDIFKQNEETLILTLFSNNYIPANLYDNKSLIERTVHTIKKKFLFIKYNSGKYYTKVQININKIDTEFKSDIVMLDYIPINLTDQRQAEKNLIKYTKRYCDINKIESVHRIQLLCQILLMMHKYIKEDQYKILRNIIYNLIKRYH